MTIELKIIIKAFRFVTEHDILQFSLFYADISQYLIFEKKKQPLNLNLFNISLKY